MNLSNIIVFGQNLCYTVYWIDIICEFCLKTIPAIKAKASIQSEGVISLFDSHDVGDNFSQFDPKVLEEISKMKQKNIAIEILEKLLTEQVPLYKRTNLVQSQKFLSWSLAS